MSDFSAIAIFCEDIRQEIGGTSTIVGILSDNMMVPYFPGVLPKLAMYIRVHIPVTFEPLEANIYINAFDDPRSLIAQIDKEMFANAIDNAKTAGAPMTGVITTIMASPFTVPKAGRIWLELDYGNENFYLGSLNFFKGNDDNLHQSQEPSTPLDK